MLDIHQTNTYSVWFRGLRDRTAKMRIEARIFRLAAGNPGQHRVLKGSVCEMKIDHGPGYRVYYTKRGATLVILLCGGDKSQQDKDIETAEALAKGV